MRTVFVNPAATNPTFRGHYSRRKNRRRNPMLLSNPDFSAAAKQTGLIAVGTLGGAAINRLGLSHITGNFYLRNGARVLTAAALTMLKVNPIASIAAAGAVLAPMIPEVETMLATKSAAQNPQELAAELADLLEADLSDDDLEGDDDGDDLEGDDDDYEISDLLDGDDDDDY